MKNELHIHTSSLPKNDTNRFHVLEMIKRCWGDIFVKMVEWHKSIIEVAETLEASSRSEGFNIVKFQFDIRFGNRKFLAWRSAG